MACIRQKKYAPWTARAKAKYIPCRNGDCVEDAEAFLNLPSTISMALSVESLSGKKAELSFKAEVWDTSYHSGSSVFKFMDSSSAQSGEVAFQLFCNTRIRRPFMKRGYLIFTYPAKDFKISPESLEVLKEHPEALRAMCEAMFKEFRALFANASRGTRHKLPVSFAFLGPSYYFGQEHYDAGHESGSFSDYESFVESVKLHQNMISVFKDAGFATFLCIPTMRGFEDYYVAYINEPALHGVREDEKLRSVDYNPLIR